MPNLSPPTEEVACREPLNMQYIFCDPPGDIIKRRLCQALWWALWDQSQVPSPCSLVGETDVKEQIQHGSTSA